LNVFQKSSAEAELVEVAPRWVHHAADAGANICWLDDLFKSNRARLFEEVCRAVVEASVFPKKARARMKAKCLLKPFPLQGTDGAAGGYSANCSSFYFILVASRRQPPAPEC